MGFKIKKITKPIKKLGKNIEKGVKKTGKELEKGTKKLGKNIEKEIKKLPKELEKTAKKVAIPVAITLLSGGTLAAAAATAGNVLIADKATKDIKNPILKAATGAAISGGLSGSSSSTIANDVVKTATITHVAKQTKSSAVAAVAGAAISGELKNTTDVVKSVTKEVARENVTKVVAKKTKNQILAQGAGHLVGVGMDNLYESLENPVNNQVIEEERQLLDNTEEQTNELDSFNEEPNKIEFESFPQESTQLEFESFPQESKQTEFEGFSNESNSCSILRKLEEDPMKSLSNKFTPMSNKNSSSSENTVFDRFQPNNNITHKFEAIGNLDSGGPNTRLKTTFKNGNSNLTVAQDFNNLKVSSSTKVNDNLYVGTAVRFNGNDIRFGTSTKVDNVYRESGVGIERGNGKWNNEGYAYDLKRTEIRNDHTGACVTKKTYEYDLEVPFCGKVGSIRQDVQTCTNSIQVTDKVGLNANAGICGVGFIPVGRAATWGVKGVNAAAKSAPIIIKNAGKIIGTLEGGALVAAAQ